jgi:hypothetical protein
MVVLMTVRQARLLCSTLSPGSQSTPVCHIAAKLRCGLGIVDQLRCMVVVVSSMNSDSQQTWFSWTTRSR